MKKYIAWILVFAMSLTLLTGCRQVPADSTTQGTEPTSTATQPAADIEGLENAIEYIRTVYKDAPELTPKDYTRIAVVPVGTEKYDVVWTVDVSEDLVKIVSDGSSNVTVDVNENVTAETPYVLTATVTDKAGNTRSYSWNHIIPLPADYSEIVNAAYALQPGESMEMESTLQGVITVVNTPYDEGYKNITVTIQVGDMEDKPIMCYRLKGEGADTLAVGDTITVTGTIKNYNGTIEFDAGCILEEIIKGDGKAPVAPEDPLQIVDEAYALGKGQTTPYVATLTGKIVEIDSPYDSNYKNVSVVIQVEGRESKPILCYRIKGDKADTLNVNDIITVQGQITNYNGKIEFVAGSKLINVVDGKAPAVVTDAARILRDAAKLGEGDKLSYESRVTGIIKQVNYAYDDNYKNVTVTIEVNGQKIRCQYLSGKGANKIGAGDEITVQGYLQNYKGALEYYKATLKSYTINRQTAPSDPMQIIKDAYALAEGDSLLYDATLTGKIVSVDTPYDSNYKNITVTIQVPGAEDKPIKCYRIKGTGAETLAVGDTITVTGTIKNYKGEVEFDAGSKITKIVKGEGPAPTEPTTEPTGEGTQPTVTVEIAEAPAVGTAYKMVMDKSGTMLYFNGQQESESVSYRLASTENAAEAVDVYLEAVEGVEGGYRLYLMKDGVKTYLKVYERVDDVAGKGKGSIEWVTETPAEYYTYDTTYKTLVHTAADGENAYYMGTYGTYTTFSVSNTSYLTAENVDKSQFPARFATVTITGELPTEPTDPSTEPSTEPTEPSTEPSTSVEIVDAPTAGTAYKLMMDKSGTMLYFNGQQESESVSYRLASTENAAEAVDVYLEAVEGVEGGYRLYLMKDGVKTYLKVYERVDDVAGKGKGSIEWVTETPAEYYTYDTTYKTLIHTAADGENAYYMGTYGTFTTFSVSNTSYLKADNVDVSQFPARFATVTITGELPTEPTDPSTEPSTEPTDPSTEPSTEPTDPSTEPSTEPTDPSTEPAYETSVEAGKSYKWGIVQENKGVTIYFAGSMNGYYGASTENIGEAVDVVLETAEGGYYVTFTDAEGAKKYVNVVVSGKYRNFTIADAASTVYTFDSENDTLTTDVDGTICYIGTYNTYDTFSVSSIDKISTSFPARFYVVSGGTEPDPTEPSTEPTDPSTEPTDPQTGDTLDVTKTYNLVMDKSGTKLYFNGQPESEKVSYRLASTENAAEAVAVYVEAVEGVEGGYRLYLMKDGVKTYLKVYERDVTNHKGSIEWVTETPAEYYTYDTTYKTLIHTAADGVNAYYMGTYGIFTTFSVSKTTYLTPEDVDVSQFPARLVEATAPVEPTDPSTEPSTEPVTEPSTEPVTEPSTAPTEAPAEMQQTVDAAYQLAEGASMEGSQTLTGEITKINEPYSSQYQNISVVITVAGREDKPILCYHMKGTGADTLAVGDTITVTGTIKNYKGTVEFDSGCTLDAVVKGDGEVPTAPADPKEILNAAYALAEGESLPYEATLTGKIISIDEAYTERYGNVTFTMVVENVTDKPIVVYRLKGDGVANLVAGDTVTVTGAIKNYGGTVEITSCTLDEIVKA